MIRIPAAFCVAMLILSACSKEQAEPKNYNVLLITVDTLRADRLGAYGYPDAGTPNFDALGQRGVVFERAFSTVPVTTPAHSGIMTGTYPTYHGVRDNGLFVLPESSVTLAEILRDRGYDTAAFVGSFPVSRRFGLAQGFAHFDDDIKVNQRRYDGVIDNPNASIFFDERNSVRVNERFLPWLREQQGKPFFAWLHYWDPHHPHIAPEPFASRFAHDGYQAEISLADASLGAVVAELDRLGLSDNTIVVVVADHGEGLGQHGEATHSLLNYNATMHVPFILSVPGVEPILKRVEENVGTIDLTPTVLAALDIDIPDHIQGRNLIPVIMNEPWAVDSDRPYYAETLSPKLSQGWGELRTLIQGDWKYIHGPRPELFHLQDDFQEWQDLSHIQAERASDMKSQLQAVIDSTASPSSANAVQDADAATLERLASLGYIGKGDVEPISEQLSEEGIPPQDRVALVSVNSRMRQALVDGNYTTVKELSEKILSEDPGSGSARGYRAYALLQLGEPEAAFAAIEDALAYLVPVSLPYYFEVLAHRFRTAANPEDALRVQTRIVEELPTADGQYLLGEMHGELGNKLEQRRLLTLALELDPTHPRARLSLAILDAEDANMKGATSNFETLIAYHPENARFRYNYAVALLMAGDESAGIEQARAALNLQPNYPEARQLLVDHGQEAP